MMTRRSGLACWFAAMLLLADAKAHAADANTVLARAVSPDVWFVQGEAALGSPVNRNFISNAGFVVTGDGVVVVDALGSPALAEALIAEIRRITPQPIRYVVVTHYHADHIYGLQAFKAIGARIVGHVGARDYLVYLRDTMGRAARDLEPFDEAYAKVDWSRFEAVPLFRLVNRMNAYNTYLLMEAQAGK